MSYLSSSPPYSHKVDLEASGTSVKNSDLDDDSDHLGNENDEEDGGGCGNNSSTHSNVFPVVSPEL